MPPRSQPTSPKKKRAKRKGSEASGQAKKSRQANVTTDTPASNLVSLQLTDDADDAAFAPRRSGRSGAGRGGRNVQLEKVASALEAPTRVNRRKGATTLSSNIPPNPLAPGSHRETRGGRTQNPPPPYSVSRTASSGVDSNKNGNKSKKPPAPNVQVPDTTYELGSESFQPGFSLREADGRFGFKPQGNPPVVLPDLQALNNPYAAMAKASVGERACAALPILNSKEVPQATPPPSRSTPSLLSHSSSRSTSIQPLSATASTYTFSEDLLDPSLRSVGYQPDDNVALRREIEPEELDTSNPSAYGSDESDGNADDNDTNTDGDAEEFGWAEVGKHHDAHPGFSREVDPSHQVRATSTLAPEFEFEYSRDEGDMNAERYLGSIDHYGDEDATAETQRFSSPETQRPSTHAPRGVQALEGSQPDDVLNRHHRTNGCPRLPDPASLEILRDMAGTRLSNGGVVIKESRSAEAKGSSNGPKPTHLAFYPHRWKNFLEDAKGDCRAYHALNKPFPNVVHDLTGTITETLMTTLVSWSQAGKLFEPDIWPLHKPDMARLLYDDLATWRSDLKKIVIVLTPTVYDLMPPKGVPVQEHAAWVERRATDLLERGAFLRGERDENGKPRNFAHPAFFEAVVKFFYTGSYRIAHRRPELFSKQLPSSCLALVAAAYNCALDGLAKDGSGNPKSYPKFTAKDYGSIYERMRVLIKTLEDHPYHGPRLTEQLESWAKTGWAACNGASGHDEKRRHDHLQIEL